MTAWTKLEPLEYVGSSCLCCPPKPVALAMGANPHPGFGTLHLERDGEIVHDGPDISSAEAVDRFTVGDYEAIAAGDPDHDWRMFVNGPLNDVTYQRHGDELWVAVERGMGFA